MSRINATKHSMLIKHSNESLNVFWLSFAIALKSALFTQVNMTREWNKCNYIQWYKLSWNSVDCNLVVIVLNLNFILASTFVRCRRNHVVECLYQFIKYNIENKKKNFSYSKSRYFSFVLKDRCVCRIVMSRRHFIYINAINDKVNKKWSNLRCRLLYFVLRRHIVSLFFIDRFLRRINTNDDEKNLKEQIRNEMITYV